MTQMSSHPAGAFCWIELATSDAVAARAFYTRLFGWGVNEFPNDKMGTYYIFTKNGRDAGAMYQLGSDMQGLPPNWLSYIAVTNVDEAGEKAKSLGGHLIMPPFDVGDMGRMTIVNDPQGAPFALWQAKSNAGLGVRDESNALCWNELQARDLDAAKKFYPALFGWRLKESPQYVEFHLAEHAVGGMMQSQSPEGVPSFWLPYFAVDDCDRATETAKSAGAQVYVPPMDIEKVGRFSVLADPQGATFAVIKLMM